MSQPYLISTLANRVTGHRHFELHFWCENVEKQAGKYRKIAQNGNFPRNEQFKNEHLGSQVTVPEHPVVMVQ
jgi:hypothetical protein